MVALGAKTFCFEVEIQSRIVLAMLAPPDGGCFAVLQLAKMTVPSSVRAFFKHSPNFLEDLSMTASSPNRMPVPVE